MRKLRKQLLTGGTLELSGDVGRTPTRRSAQKYVDMVRFDSQAISLQPQQWAETDPPLL
jgi:hypothetical protein